MNNQSEDNYYGFIGKILKINLTKNAINYEDTNLSITKDFMGGAGYACRYLIDKINKDLDPFSPENILMIMTGPLCLTSAPSLGRFVICAKSPYTNIWGESNCGGVFGPELKRAGYDGIIILGKAENPVYITIFNDNVVINDATELWGKGVKNTQRRLKILTKVPKPKVLSIGPAGENLVKFSNINADGRAAGRTGMGAVMGSKNLKAIVVKGSNYKPKIANPEGFQRVTKKAIKYILESISTKALRGFGTSAGIIPSHSRGDLPIKYWSQGEWKEVINISGEKLKENHLLKNKSCYSCSIGCGRIIEINNVKCRVPEGEGPEYETIVGFGSMILNNNLEIIAMANHLCDCYGIDTISMSGVIALLYDLYNRNIVSKTDIEGFELDWGNISSLLELIKKTAYREGIGDLLANGSIALGEKFNVSKDDIAAINNLEVPYHDIRSCYGLALTYAFGPRGPCHTTGDVFKVLREENEIDFSSLGIEKVNMFSNNKKMVKSTALLQDYRALYSSLISCFFSNPPPIFLAEMIETLFGIDFNLETLKIMGERIFTIKRLFNIKMGLTPKDDNIPKVLLKPTNEGAVKGKSPDFERLKKYYYKIRNWNPITGIPNPTKLNELNLENIKF